eukprot:GGOE01021893.1.p1 GENE.GGOE01021893.1~~GGOE01021893.1.p1  ORF type:complete len:171 (+),score=6.98 GGOE01021893.1:76-513(+)
MAPLPEAVVAAQECLSPKAHRSRHRRKTAGHAVEPVFLIEDVIQHIGAASGPTGELSPRADSEGEDVGLLPLAAKSGGHRRHRHRAKARIHTCAPPPGSQVLAGITVVPVASPTAETAAALGPRVHWCSPPPGSEVVDGITVVSL